MKRTVSLSGGKKNHVGSNNLTPLDHAHMNTRNANVGCLNSTSNGEVRPLKTDIHQKKKPICDISFEW